MGNEYDTPHTHTQKRPTLVSKETYTSVKRDLHYEYDTPHTHTPPHTPVSGL
jgi:hypothetical protein